KIDARRIVGSLERTRALGKVQRCFALAGAAVGSAVCTAGSAGGANDLLVLAIAAGPGGVLGEVLAAAMAGKACHNREGAEAPQKPPASHAPLLARQRHRAVSSVSSRNNPDQACHTIRLAAGRRLAESNAFAVGSLYLIPTTRRDYIPATFRPARQSAR